MTIGIADEVVIILLLGVYVTVLLVGMSSALDVVGVLLGLVVIGDVVIGSRIKECKNVYP